MYDSCRDEWLITGPLLSGLNIADFVTTRLNLTLSGKKTNSSKSYEWTGRLDTEMFFPDLDLTANATFIFNPKVFIHNKHNIFYSFFTEWT